MVLKASTEPLPELAEFLAPFAHHFVRSEGREDLERYSTGLLSDLPHKNGDTIAAAIPGTNAQRLQELLTRINWDDQAFNAQRVQWMSQRVRHGPGALVLDDTGFAKQGRSSVGVSRQYSGTLGKVGNCQVAVTSVYADAGVSWPVGVTCRNSGLTIRPAARVRGCRQRSSFRPSRSLPWRWWTRRISGRYPIK